MAGVYCGLTVSVDGEGFSWVLLLLLLHTGVSTIGTGGMSKILLLLLLYTEVSTIGTSGGCRRKYYIELNRIFSRSINSSFTE